MSKPNYTIIQSKAHVDFQLPYERALKLVRTIRGIQDQAKKLRSPEGKALDLELEGVKMSLVNQMPSMLEVPKELV